MRIVVFGFGRMNPPTIGHKRLAQAIVARASKETNTNTGSQVSAILLLSSKDVYTGKEREKNPLTPQLKLKWAEKIFRMNNIDIQLSPYPSAMQAIDQFLTKADKIVYVHGSDPEQVEFANRIVKEIDKNGKLGASEKLTRSSNNITEQGISATLIRGLVRDGKINEFKKAYPTLSSKEAEQLFFDIRKGMTYK